MQLPVPVLCVIMNVPRWEPSPDPGRFLYQQVAAHISMRIAAGDLAAGQRLPAEPELAAEYGVAYHTARGAIRVLREQGLVITMHGRGNFVAARPDAPPPGPGGGAPAGAPG
jgi:GntR family transcriptional regulator